MPAQNERPSPKKFNQNRKYYNRHIVQMLTATNRELNDLHVWQNPFVSRKSKKELMDVIEHTPDYVIFTATVVSHVIDEHPFRDKNLETAISCLTKIIGCTGQHYIGNASELDELLLSLKDSRYGCYSYLYNWLNDRVVCTDNVSRKENC